MKRLRAKDGVLQFFVWVIVVVGTLAWFIIVKNDSSVGKAPDFEEVLSKAERDLRTGELFRIEIIRCRLCGQVLSYVRFNLRGKAVSGHSLATHNCPRIIAKNKYDGADFGPKEFNIWKFLEKWQKRLSERLKETSHGSNH